VLPTLASAASSGTPSVVLKVATTAAARLWSTGSATLVFRSPSLRAAVAPARMFHADVWVLEKVRLPVRQRQQFVREVTTVEQSTDASRSASTHGPNIVDESRESGMSDRVRNGRLLA